MPRARKPIFVVIGLLLILVGLLLILGETPIPQTKVPPNPIAPSATTSTQELYREG